MQKKYFVSEKTRKREFKFQLALFFVVMMMLFAPMQRVFAYESWIKNPAADNMYGGLTAQDKVNEMENSEEDAHSHILLNFLIKLPDGITNALQGSSNSQYNFSIDGIILGRLASGTAVNYTGFDFGNNNPWSSIGAVIYQCLRAVCLGGMMYVFMGILIKNIFMTGEKARSYLKEYVSTMVFMFVLIYVMPQVLDMIIYWRDTVLNIIHNALNSSGIASSSSTSIIEEYRNIAVNEMNLFNVLLYTGAAISTLWYLMSYLKIAVIQAMLFGIFPLIAVFSVHNRKLINDWFWMFIGNVMTPVLDFVILLMPIVVDNTISTNKLLKALIKLAILMSAIPARNAVLRLISMHSGLSVGGGFGALGALGAAAAGTGLRGAKSAAGTLANREGDADKSGNTDTPEMGENFRTDTDKIAEIVDGNDDNSVSADASINGDAQDDESMSAFEQSQEAVEDQISGGEDMGADVDDADFDRTGYTEENEPDIPDAENAYGAEEGEESAGFDQTGTSGNNPIPYPVPDGDNSTNAEGNNTSIAAAEGNAVDVNKVDQLGEEGRLDGSSSESNISGDSSNHVVNGNGADKETDMTGIAAKVPIAEPDADSGDARTNPASKQNYNESAIMEKFNDARFKNLQSLDTATAELGSLKAQENKLSEDHTTHSSAFANAKENLNAVRQETTAAVNKADHNVDVASRNLTSARQEQISATENKAAMDNNAHASHEQRAAADARLSSANQEMQKAQSNFDNAKAAQAAAKQDQETRMAEARKNVNITKEALDRTTKDMKANSAAQRTENAKIMQSKQREEQFRNMSQSYGMSNRGYTNAADFNRQRIVDSQKRSLANYKNFDSANFKNVLSPDERSQFQRQRELAAVRNKRLEMAKNVVTGNVSGAWHTAETKGGKVAGAAGALAGKAAQTAGKATAFGAGAVVGSFGGVGGAAIVGGTAAKMAGANKSVANFAVTEAQSKSLPENSYGRNSSYSESSGLPNGSNKTTQQKKSQKKTTQSAGGTKTSSSVITKNAVSGKNDSDIGNIIR